MHFDEAPSTAMNANLIDSVSRKDAAALVPLRAAADVRTFSVLVLARHSCHLQVGRRRTGCDRIDRMPSAPVSGSLRYCVTMPPRPERLFGLSFPNAHSRRNSPRHPVEPAPSERYAPCDVCARIRWRCGPLWLANSQLCRRHPERIRVPVIGPEPAQGQVHAAAEHTVAFQTSPRREFRTLPQAHPSDMR
jgi:hypothetical protein